MIIFKHFQMNAILALNNFESIGMLLLPPPPSLCILWPSSLGESLMISALYYGWKFNDKSSINQNVSLTNWWNSHSE